VNAIGFDEERGDKVAVEEIPFDRLPPDAELARGARTGMDVHRLIGPVLRFFALLGAIVLLGVVLKKNIFSGETAYGPRKGERRRAASAASSSRTAEEEEEAFSDLQAQSMKMMEQGASVEKEIGKLVDSFPVESESVLKQWLEEK
jgi:flagellar biosynthesis/type III secretory pathway M-ring protein FliF/YscJ